MFRFFETLVDPYTAHEGVDQPPRRLWPVLRGLAVPSRGGVRATGIMPLPGAAVAPMDRVVGMDAGHVRGEGPPAGVLARQGLDDRFRRWQSGGFAGSDDREAAK